jgi:hypothetical protein
MKSVNSDRDVQTQGNSVGSSMAVTANTMGVSNEAMVALLVWRINDVEERDADTDELKISDKRQIAFFTQVRTHF